MKNIIKLSLSIIALSLCIGACKKDKVIDGGISSEKLDITTYDFIKSNPRNMFDTTLIIIDKAGLKDVINSSGTFFIPNDYAIVNFVNLKAAEARLKDTRKTYTFDSLYKYFTPKMLKDSMGMYFFPTKIVRTDLNDLGKSFVSNTANVSLDVSLEEENDYLVGGVITSKPKYIYLNKILGAKDILVNGSKQDPTGNVKLKDIKALCQTTGLITNTGVVHVLSNSHAWTFKQNPQ